MTERASKSKREQILSALDKAISHGPWDNSVFLQGVRDKLQALRQSFIDSLTLQQEPHEKEHVITESVSPQDKVLVYVSLYNADGNNMEKWYQTIMHVMQRVASRSVYAEESHAQTLLADKDNRHNEAYLAVYVSEVDILSTHELATTDKYGHQLLQLKDRALELHHVAYLQHQSGRYEMQHGQLVLLPSEDEAGK